MPAPDFGIDPALLAPMAPQPAAVDPLQAAIDALLASGATVGPVNPALYSGSPQSTDLEPLPMDPHPVDPYPSQPTAQYDESGRQIHGRLLPEGSVTVTGQQRTPTSAAQDNAIRAQNYQTARSAELADPNFQPGASDVEGWSAREGHDLRGAAEAKAQEAAAAHAAAQELAQRTADAHLTAADEMSAANNAHQVARKAEEARIDADMAAWHQEYAQKAAQEPNPDRWWDNRSDLGKALWGLGMVFGAGYVALTPGAQNVALGMAMDAIKQDVAIQKERLARELEASKMKGAIIEKRGARNLTDLADDHTMVLGRLEVLRQAHIARAAAPGAAGLKAGLAQAESWFANEVMRVSAARRNDAIQISQADLGRRHATTMQSIRLKH
jgi:hypothetical protein